MNKLTQVNKTNWIDLNSVARVTIYTFSEEPSFEVEFTFNISTYGSRIEKVYLNEHELDLLNRELSRRYNEISS